MNDTVRENESRVGLKAVVAGVAAVVVWSVMSDRVDGWLTGLSTAIAVIAVHLVVPPPPAFDARRTTAIAIATAALGAATGWAVERWLV